MVWGGDSLNFARGGVESEWAKSQSPCRPGEGRGPYAAAPRCEAVSVEYLAQQRRPVVMGPGLRRGDNYHCVFATRGGTATVLNCVASSTAGANSGRGAGRGGPPGRG